MEMWKERVFRHIRTPIGYKVDHNSKEVSKALFARVCLEADSSKPLKMNIKYFRDGNLYEC